MFGKNFGSPSKFQVDVNSLRTEHAHLTKECLALMSRIQELKNQISGHESYIKQIEDDILELKEKRETFLQLALDQEAEIVLRNKNLEESERVIKEKFDELEESKALLSKFRIDLTAAPGAAKSYTFTTRKNGASGNEVVAITGTAVTGTDATNTDAYVGGDSINLMHVSAGTPALADAFWAWKMTTTPVDMPVASSARLLTLMGVGT